MFKTNFLCKPHLKTLTFAAVLLCVGCSGLYDLPDPPPKSEWTGVSLIPGEDERNSERQYLEASAAAMDLYSALSDSRWDEAWSLLSAETRSALSYGNSEGDGKLVIQKGRYEGRGSKEFPQAQSTFRFDPVEHFIVEDLMRFEDEKKGAPEAETNRRKEIYAVSRDGQIKKVVLIYEEGNWRVHKTGFAKTNLNFDL